MYISIIRLNRLLSEEVITAAVRALRISFSLASLPLIAWVAYTLVRGRMDASTIISNLESKSKEIIDAGTASATDRRDRKHDFSLIARKKIFGELGTKSASAPASKPVISTVFGLVGTFVQQGQTPFAIIEDTKKSQQEVFNINDMVFNEAKLQAIYPDRVEILRNGQTEILLLDESQSKSPQFDQGVASLENDEFIVEEGELDKALENLPLLLTQARAVPYFQDGRAVGLRLFAIRSGSLFEKLGLTNADILKTVNGNSLADMSQAITLFQKLKDERSITVQLERNKQDREFKYQIK